jgi:hypothetical protein
MILDIIMFVRIDMINYKINYQKIGKLAFE